LEAAREGSIAPSSPIVKFPDRLHNFFALTTKNHNRRARRARHRSVVFPGHPKGGRVKMIAVRTPDRSRTSLMPRAVALLAALFAPWR
jgi:hypothetical protein